MPTRLTVKLMVEFISSPESFWPDSGRFHSRNRLKVQRALAEIGNSLNPRHLAERMVEIIRKREALGTRNLLAMSNGSSGCHYLGELLNEFPGFQMTDEVYYPPTYIEAIQLAKDPDAWMALDFLDLLHTGRLDESLIETTVVNIGHLRPDARPKTLREAGYSPRFLLLLRNPFDVALGRAFRKDAYRSEVDPDASDDEYLRKQGSYTAGFLKRTRRELWDVVIRYEDLITSPVAVLRDLSLTLGEDWELGAIDQALRKYDPNRGSSESLSTNLNTRPREAVAPRHARILVQTLEGVAEDFGYEPPERVASGLKHGTPELLLPLYAEESQYNEERFRAFQRGRIKVFRSQPETDLIEDPNWISDPVSSKTWRLYYHSLSWLLSLAWGADNTQARNEILEEIKTIVFSYLNANVFSSADDEMAWDDHAAADRLSILAELLAHYIRPILSAGEEELFRQGLEAHVRRLESFYESRRWISSNHGLFHAVALINASLVLPDGQSGIRAGEVGEKYLFDVVEAMVDPSEGVSLEQSVAYHSINLILLRRITSFLSQNSIEGLERLVGISGLMLEFNLAIRGTDNRRLAIGDTPFGDKIPETTLEPIGHAHVSEHAAYSLTHGREGSPFPDLLLYRSVGWALFRVGEAFDGQGEVTRAIFTFSPERGPHGHFDALSFSLQHAGWDVLIDSGGPYSYGDPMRFEYFAGPRAHNTVLIGDRSHYAGGQLVSSGQVGRTSYVVAQHDGYEQARLVRAVVHLSPKTFAIVDASSTSDDVLSFSTLWHLAPDVSVSRHQTENSELFSVVSNDIEAHIQVWNASMRRSRIVTGSENGVPFGWVTSATDTRTEAPTIVCETSSRQLFSVTTVSIGEPNAWVEVESSSCRFGKPGRPNFTVAWTGETLEASES